MVFIVSCRLSSKKSSDSPKFRVGLDPSTYIFHKLVPTPPVEIPMMTPRSAETNKHPKANPPPIFPNLPQISHKLLTSPKPSAAPTQSVTAPSNPDLRRTLDFTAHSCKVLWLTLHRHGLKLGRPVPQWFFVFEGWKVVGKGSNIWRIIPPIVTDW